MGFTTQPYEQDRDNDNNQYFPQITNKKEARGFLAELNKKEIQYLTESLQSFKGPQPESADSVAEHSSHSDKISSQQLSAVALGNFIPFVGFGLTIMAAAAMGNMVAYLAGLSLAGYIESYSDKLSIVQHNLSSEQFKTTSVKVAKYGG